VATQRDAKQEPHSRHDPITLTDTRTSLNEVQLETSHFVGRLHIGRAFEPSGKLLTAINVAECVSGIGGPKLKLPQMSPVGPLFAYAHVSFDGEYRG
jgi:hypothetical protein